MPGPPNAQDVATVTIDNFNYSFCGASFLCLVLRLIDWRTPVSADESKKPTLKQKAAHELQEFLGIFLYLAFFFCALSTYSMLLLNRFQVSYFTYGAALINALVIAKVILIGEYARLGTKHESKPIFQSALYKAFVFGLLVFGFHIVEEMIKRLIHGEDIARASHGIRLDELLARSVVIFSTFLPLFAFRELQRIMGEDKFRDLFFKTGGGEQAGSAGKN
jgi:hypothetical protein